MGTMQIHRQSMFLKQLKLSSNNRSKGMYIRGLRAKITFRATAHEVQVQDSLRWAAEG